MSWIRLFKSTHYILLPTLAMSLILACGRLPNPKFSYLPRENTEAGDSIWFTNQSRAGDHFAWDFGDGNTSVEDDPKHVYFTPGVYEVILTATNDVGEGSFSELIPVNDPTVLGFVASDSSGIIQLKDAEIWVYADLEDLDNQYNSHFHGITDSLGILFFHNVEPRVYYVQVIRQEEKGRWVYRGFTSALNQNKVNRFTVPCIWIEWE